MTTKALDSRIASQVLIGLIESILGLGLTGVEELFAGAAGRKPVVAHRFLCEGEILLFRALEDLR